MSNHEHLIVRDNRGNLPEFMAHLHKMTAKALNAHWGRWENFWAAEQPSVVYLVEAADRFDKLVYLLANPVAEHLVEHVSDWPGACSLMQNLSGRSRTVRRPRSFFRDGGPMPDAVTLVAERLDGFEHLDHEQWAEKISDAVRAEEDRARVRRAEKKQRVLGRKAVLRSRPTDSPGTFEPRRGLRPHLACRNVERRKHELTALRGFRTAHRVARRRFSAGERGTLFPPGTYRMRDFGVQCAKSPDAAAMPPA